MSQDPVLQEQIAYYRVRASEYDRTTGTASPPKGWRKDALGLLRQVEPCEWILELGCGTGQWTQALLTVGQEITAVDAAPEMLAINERKTGSGRVHYACADLFTWEPDRHYDVVLFAFWLSHVPPGLLDAFLDKVGRAIRPGVRLVIVDQHAPTDEDRLCAAGGIYATRPLVDGRTFTIVKVFHDLTSLERSLTGRGLVVTTHRLDDVFFFLSGQSPRSLSPHNPMRTLERTIDDDGPDDRDRRRRPPRCRDAQWPHRGAGADVARPSPIGGVTDGGSLRSKARRESDPLKRCGAFGRRAGTGGSPVGPGPDR